MPQFTIEATYLLPVFRHRTYEADSLDAALQMAVEDDDWEGQKEDYETPGPTYITGAWEGDVEPYSTAGVPIPTRFLADCRSKPRQVSVWQLANDPEAYGDNAGKFILVSPDGEDEVETGVAMFNPFDTADEAQDYATVRGWEVVPLAVPSAAPTPREYPVCSYCGSDDVRADAYAAWNHQAQAWDLSATFDKGSVCESCGGETDITWKQGYPPAAEGERGQS